MAAQNISIEHVAPDALRPAPYNPRTMTDEARARLRRGIETFGLVDPIVARRSDGLVIGGHQRLHAAKEIGVATVPVVYLDDVDDQQAAALNVLLNNPSAQGEWDMARLSELLSELDATGFDATLTGFDTDALEGILAWTPEPEKSGEESDDVDLTPPAEPKSRPGEVYQLGRHRLVCGDSTDATAWDRLMDGREADMVWTDPPYGVAYVGKTKDALTIENDALDEAGLEDLLRAALSLAWAHSRAGAVWYVAAPAGPLHLVFAKVLHDLGVWRQTIQWVKDTFVLGRSDYHYRNEPIFYGWKEGAAHYFVDDRTQDTIWEIDRPKASKDHPTMKPLALIKRALENSSRSSEIVVDPFGGSGSTLIAAEQTGRTGYLIELDPRYCDVIRRRYAELVGQPELAP